MSEHLKIQWACCFSRVALPSYVILIGENGQDVRFSALGQGRPYARRVIDIA